jgi:predicted methyltransferase
MKRIVASLVLTFATLACSQQESEPSAGSADSGHVDPSVYAAAVATTSRPEADLSRDAGRKPADVLEFFGIVPGMSVLDLFSGGGYYAEILSYLVGPDGHIVAHSNSAYLNFVGDEFKARHADNRLANVDVLMAENNELELDTSQFDAILMVLSYHDSYWVAPDNNWLKINVPQLHAEMFNSLKPGGILGVIDHYAEAGSPRETGGTLHRIDRGIVIAELENAGFVLDAKSDLLRNMEDDHSVGVFDPSVRGKTDRFVLRFKKPE